jgi:hypothetical protein
MGIRLKREIYEVFINPELELIQTQMAQKPMLRAEVYAQPQVNVTLGNFFDRQDEAGYRFGLTHEH